MLDLDEKDRISVMVGTWDNNDILCAESFQFPREQVFYRPLKFATDGPLSIR